MSIRRSRRAARSRPPIRQAQSGCRETRRRCSARAEAALAWAAAWLLEPGASAPAARVWGLRPPVLVLRPPAWALQAQAWALAARRAPWGPAVFFSDPPECGSVT